MFEIIILIKDYPFKHLSNRNMLVIDGISRSLHQGTILAIEYRFENFKMRCECYGEIIGAHQMSCLRIDAL